MAVTIKINPCPERYNSANPYKTGQTTSYVSNDDGDLQRGRGSDFTTLDFNNPFGNTNRFTDTLGGQTYANDIVIDWATTNYISETVIGWYRVVQGGAGVNWTTAMAAQPVTAEGYNDWYVPNKNEFTLIISSENSINYNPFSLTHNLWTSSSRDASAARVYQEVQKDLQTQLKTLTLLNGNAIGYILLRYFTFTELGL